MHLLSELGYKTTGTMNLPSPAITVAEEGRLAYILKGIPYLKTSFPLWMNTPFLGEFSNLRPLKS